MGSRWTQCCMGYCGLLTNAVLMRREPRFVMVRAFLFSVCVDITPFSLELEAIREYSIWGVFMTSFHRPAICHSVRNQANPEEREREREREREAERYY